MPIPAQRARRNPTRPTARLGVKVGASVTAVAVVLGGGAAAAFANVLPAPIQRLAHEAIGAPTPPPPHGLPHRGRPAAPGQPAARGGPGAERQAHPHATLPPTAQGRPHAQGKRGNPQGKGPHGQQGQGSGQGQGNGQGKLLHEFPLLGKHLHAVVGSIANVHQSIPRNMHAMDRVPNCWSAPAEGL